MSNKKTKTSKIKIAKASRKSQKSKQTLLDNLEQTNGKVYEDDIARAREIEEILGTKRLSPFKTTDKNVFQDIIKDMNLTDLQSFAVKVGVFPNGNKTVLKSKLTKAFETSLYGKGVVQLQGRSKKLNPNNPQEKEIIDYLKD
jgi:hypothetical protein